MNSWIRTRNSWIWTRKPWIWTRNSRIWTRTFQFQLVLLCFQLVTRNSCFTISRQMPPMSCHQQGDYVWRLMLLLGTFQYFEGQYLSRLEWQTVQNGPHSSVEQRFIDFMKTYCISVVTRRHKCYWILNRIGYWILGILAVLIAELVLYF